MLSNPGDRAPLPARPPAFSYLRVFFLGWLMVSLVSANTRQIALAQYLPAGGIGFLISFVWMHITRLINDKRDLAHTLAYATGAACGTMTGIFITHAVYGR